MKKVIPLVLSIIVIVLGVYFFVSGLSGIISDKGEHTEIMDMSVDDRAKYLKENCKALTYEEIARTPDEHKNELVVLTGEVIQVQQSSNKTILLVNVTYNGDEYFSYYTDTVYVKYKFADELKTLDGDIITMYGEFLGEKDYVSVLGQKMTVPNVEVYYAELNK